MAIKFVFDDGGREAAGFPALEAEGFGDCQTRSIAIACDWPYGAVHAVLWDIARRTSPLLSVEQGLSRGPSPDRGVALGVGAAFLESIGWEFTLNRFEQARGQVSHRTLGELGRGRYIAELRQPQGGGHVTAVIDGRVHDIWNCSTKPVYGWWTKARGPVSPLPAEYYDQAGAFVPAASAR